jgi:hypothetical protein
MIKRLTNRGQSARTRAALSRTAQLHPRHPFDQGCDFVLGESAHTRNRITHGGGARQLGLIRLVLGQGLRLTLIGMGIGLVGALGVTRVLSNVLYGISPTDPISFLAVGVLLTVVALAASYAPARWATRVDPISALRSE